VPWRIFLLSVLLLVLSMERPSAAAPEITLVEGDIVVSAQPTARGISLADNTLRWPAGIVPYVIDPALDQNSVNAILEAIQHWNEIGGISLLPLAQAQKLSPTPIADSVRFIEGEFCASWVGRRGGLQDVWIAPYCPAGSVMHEIGHLLGLEHEHTRPDRDQYIEIHWDNIEPDKLHNFDTAPRGSFMPGAYDYNSIMHYGSHNFSSNGLATISPIDSEVRSIGQRVSPSPGDLQAIAQLYASDLSLSTKVTQSAGGTELDIFVTNESAQGAHNVSVVIEMTTDPAASRSLQDAWDCKADGKNRTLGCSLGQLAGSSAELLTVELPDNQVLADVAVTLSAKTPDNNLSNNNSKVRQSDTALLSDESTVLVVAADASDSSAVLQEDAVAHVALSGGGAISMHALLLLLLLFVRQAGSRIYLWFLRYLFSQHWGNLIGR